MKKDWNDYILDINKKIIDLDNDKPSQKKLIESTFNEAIKNINFNRKFVIEWYKSQMMICFSEIPYIPSTTEVYLMQIDNILKKW